MREPSGPESAIGMPTSQELWTCPASAGHGIPAFASVDDLGQATAVGMKVLGVEGTQ
jgi:hypothetical protein